MSELIPPSSSHSTTRPISSHSSLSEAKDLNASLLSTASAVRDVNSEALRKQWTEGFRLFESKPKDFIPSKDLGMLMRTQLKNPSDSQVLQYIRELDPDNHGYISLDGYLRLMANPDVPDPDSQLAVLEAFEVFDPEQKGTMSATELRNILVNIGEKDLNDDEIMELIRAFSDDDNGTASYAAFIKTCFSNIDIHKKKENPKSAKKKSPKKR
ncbi:calmodulin [Acrasis kona]|uniref:Calmodulin n=1 Tax=Acrasis kona TaxID=1008807 RepID=A0AAW2ZH57_9EUKA